MLKRRLKQALFPVYQLVRTPLTIWERYQLKKQLHSQNQLRIVIGAKAVHEDGWIPTERETLDMLKPRDWQNYFAPDSIEAIMAEHVWEHLTPEQGMLAAQHCYTYLKPGGYLRIAVPDGLHPDPSYIAYVRPNGTGIAADDHKVLYTYQTLGQILKAAGFNVEMLEYFDEAGEFHYREWRPEDGKIRRSKRFDRRNQDGTLRYTSLIVDARKG